MRPNSLFSRQKLLRFDWLWLVVTMSLLGLIMLGQTRISAASPGAVLRQSRQVCANTYPTQLAVGERALVAPEPPLANIVRSKPTRTATSVGKIQPGEAMTILDGPECADGWIWWYVRSDGDRTGWTSEGDAAGYWLVPVLAANATNAIISNLYSCFRPCQSTGANSLGVFPEETERIYLRWQYENIPSGSSYVRAWSMNGREWIRYACTWPGPENGIHEISLLESSGLHSGLWTMRIEVEGKVVAEAAVTLMGDHTLWEPVGVRNDCAEGVAPLTTLPATATPVPTSTPQSVGVADFFAYGVANDNANLRSGPGTSYTKVGRAEQGTIVHIIGRNGASSWYRLENYTWVAAYLVDICDSSYPSVCIPIRLPDLDCTDLLVSDFAVLPPDRHGFDEDLDGIGCEGSVATPTVPTPRSPTPTPRPPVGNCDASYPGVCIPPAPPDLDCGQIEFRRFQVVGSDPHGFDGDGDGLACER